MISSEIDDGNDGVKNTAAVNIIGAVSPAALLIPRIPPVKIPGMAAGSTTLKIVCSFVAPSAKDASRYVAGTAFNASSVVSNEPIDLGLTSVRLFFL